MRIRRNSRRQTGKEEQEQEKMAREVGTGAIGDREGGAGARGTESRRQGRKHMSCRIPCKVGPLTNFHSCPSRSPCGLRSVHVFNLVLRVGLWGFI